MDLPTWVELNITLKGVMGVLWIGMFVLLKGAEYKFKGWYDSCYFLYTLAQYNGYN